MTKLMSKYKIIGLMSGTSLDGLDLAYCHFTKVKGRWQYKLVTQKSLEYTPAQRQKLKNSVHLPAADLLHLDILFGEWLGSQVKIFIEEEELEPEYVASHGHTVFHQPHRRLTWQMGHGQELANVSGLPVISDFRSSDVLLGGQGAPLVPIGDRELFGDYSFCLNLGGIANMSFDLHGQRIAYDICPVNMLLNEGAQQLDLPYDAGGRMAREGTLNREVLAELDALPYYQEEFPKSLGYEWFVSEVMPIIKHSKLVPADLLRTGVEHIAQRIIQDVLQFNPSEARMLVTGGGAYNDFLIQQIRVGLHQQVEVIVPENYLVEYKEAIVFALMGAMRLNEEVNCLRTVTGARKDSSAGHIFYPD
jgi:anhydro-N-acetylmuramic acid kinase